MKYSNEIPDKNTTFNISLFGGLNRRLKTSAGEFSDMENMGHGEYPCLSSIRNYKTVLEPGVEIVKHIIPKRMDASERTGFTGIAKRGDNYYIYVNGVENVVYASEFTDAIDFNGTIIMFPSFDGYNYTIKNETGSSGKEMGIYYRETKVSFKNIVSNDNDVTGTSFKTDISYNTFINNIDVGAAIELSGFEGTFKENNTIYPESSLDFSNLSSPVSITVSEITKNGTYAEFTCVARNAKGKIIKLKKGGDDVSYSPEMTIAISAYAPKGDCFCMHDNRLWCASSNGEMIQTSALGSPFEFYELGTLSTDSWYTEVGTPGKFTGIASWHNRVLAFKKDWLHIIYGTEPLNYSLEKSYTNGCVCKESIATAGNSLIWLSHDGFYEYMGSVPRRISDKLNTKYVSCVAFSDTRRYYASCVKENGDKEFVIFDTETGLWTKVSGADIIGGDSAEGKVYFWDKEKVYEFGAGEFGDFYAETPPLTFDSFRDKAFVYLQIRCVMGEKAFLNVYTAVEDGEWTPHKGIDKSGRHRIPVRYNSGDTLRIRFEGSGEVHITDAELIICSGGERS